MSSWEREEEGEKKKKLERPKGLKGKRAREPSDKGHN